MANQKSLRAMAKEMGVSPSYLSQVKNGKRPPSKKVLSSPSYEMLNTLASDRDLKSVRPHSLCGFESRPRHLLNTTNKVLSKFIQSRRQGLSPQTIGFYQCYLNLANPVMSTGTKGQDIIVMLQSFSDKTTLPKC